MQGANVDGIVSWLALDTADFRSNAVHRGVIGGGVTSPPLARSIPVPIGSRAFEVMEVLVRSAGEFVTKDNLMDRVWPGAIIEENTLRFTYPRSARRSARIEEC